MSFAPTHTSRFAHVRFEDEDRIRAIVRALHATDKRGHIPPEVRAYVRKLHAIGVSANDIHHRLGLSRWAVACIIAETD